MVNEIMLVGGYLSIGVLSSWLISIYDQVSRDDNDIDDIKVGPYLVIGIMFWPMVSIIILIVLGFKYVRVLYVGSIYSTSNFLRKKFKGKKSK